MKNIQNPILLGIDLGSDSIKAVVIDDGRIKPITIITNHGNPIETLIKILQEIKADYSDQKIHIGVSGTGAKSLNGLGEPIFESSAIAKAINSLYPDTATAIEMGRTTQRFIIFRKEAGELVVGKSFVSGNCAAGSGGFLAEMMPRLNYKSWHDFNNEAIQSTNPASLSDRCGVFRESDIVGQFQIGTPPGDIAAGIFQSIATSFTTNMGKNLQLNGNTLFFGGVSKNPAQIKFLEQTLNTKVTVPDNNNIPDLSRLIMAIGSALLAKTEININQVIVDLTDQSNNPAAYPTANPISLKNVCYLTDTSVDTQKKDFDLICIGIDVGSVSTKGVVIGYDDNIQVVLAKYYRWTIGDPLTATLDVIANLESQLVEKRITYQAAAAATTGSGRYMIANLIGATAKNEMTCQAFSVSSYMETKGKTISIIEIGGQDSKYIKLVNGIPVTMNMNFACAAGCGSFLQKIAKWFGLDLNQLGDYALRSSKPLGHINQTCTILAQLSLEQFIGIVPVEDIIAGVCFNSVRNYLIKTQVEEKSLGDIVVFQGAPAKNAGIVGAFATHLNRPIIIPPYPEITGAIGAAMIAYRNYQGTSEFRGFAAIKESNPIVNRSICPDCKNHCQLNVLEVTKEDGDKEFFYSNDRCGKHSQARRAVKTTLPNLFNERKQMMERTFSPCLENAPTIGMPKILLYSSYGPLFQVFLSKLGFKVVLSDDTNRETINLGVKATIGGPCLPIKAMHGHVLDLLNRGVKVLFIPRVLSSERVHDSLIDSKSCPLVQATPELCDTTLDLTARGIKVITPELYFDRGYKHLKKVFAQIAQELGKDKKDAVLALSCGLEALAEFREGVKARGKEILNSLGPDDKAFVVVTRPYGLDEFMNLRIGPEIQNLGVLAIPQDFLSFDDCDISDKWGIIFSTQVQLKIAVARIVNSDPRLEAVMISYFGCGPDAFANAFFQQELDRFLLIQLDEHTTLANLITRLESFHDAVVMNPKVQIQGTFRHPDTSISKIGQRTILIPSVNDFSQLMAACFRICGKKAEVIPSSPDPNLSLARQHVTGDQCIPSIITLEDALYAITNNLLPLEHISLFMGNARGPCRFGYYSSLMRIVLDKLGYQSIPIVTLGGRSAYKGIGMTFAKLVWDAGICHDLLFKMLLKTRPYEINHGDSINTFNRYIIELIDVLPDHKKRLDSLGLITLVNSAFNPASMVELSSLLQRAQRDFSSIPVHRNQRPIVGVVGEFYVRLSPRANMNLIDMLESLGVEVRLDPMYGFFDYSNKITAHHLAHELSDRFGIANYASYLLRGFMAKLIRTSEHALVQACLPYLDDYIEIASDELIARGSQLISWKFGGEAICSLAISELYAKQGICGIINDGPFKCMPSYVVEVRLREIAKLFRDLPILSINHDGYPDLTRDLNIAEFVNQAKRRHTSMQSIFQPR